MTAIEYAESRLAELPLLWDSQDQHETTETAWKRLFGGSRPPDEYRTAAIDMRSQGSYHEYPEDRVLLSDVERTRIYGILPKPPIDWAPDGEAIVKALRDLNDAVGLLARLNR